MGQTHLVEPSVYCAKMVVVVFRAGLHFVQLGLDGGLLALVLSHLAQNGILLIGLYRGRVSAWNQSMAAQRRLKRIGGGGRTSMSSFHGMSASGCGRAPLAVTACLFAGGAASSCPLGLLRSSILTASSEGGATVLASSLIGQATSERRRHGTRSACRSKHGD